MGMRLFTKNEVDTHGMRSVRCCRASCPKTLQPWLQQSSCSKLSDLGESRSPGADGGRFKTGWTTGGGREDFRICF